MQKQPESRQSSMSGLVVVKKFLKFPSEPPVASLISPNGAQQARARAARRSEPLPASTVRLLYARTGERVSLNRALHFSCEEDSPLRPLPKFSPLPTGPSLNSRHEPLIPERPTRITCTAATAASAPVGRLREK